MSRSALSVFRSAAPLALVVLGGCATNVPPPAAGDAERGQAQARCRGIAYENRRVVGRGPPNWNFYDYCMRQFDAQRAVRQGVQATDAQPQAITPK
jgi:hypothetical protein